MVDIAERLFSRWLSVKASIEKKRHNIADTGIELATVRERMQILGALLSGGPVEIKGGEVLDEAGECVQLPDSFNLLANKTLNESVLKYRLLFVVTSWKLGLVCPPSLPPDARLLRILLSISEVNTAIEAEYESARDLRRKIEPLLLHSMPRTAKPNTRAAILEGCIRRFLGAPPECPTVPLVEQIFSSRGESLDNRFDRFWAAITKAAPRVGKLAADRAILWGLVTPGERGVSLSSAPPENKNQKAPAKVIALNRTVHAKLQDPTKQESAPLFHSFEKTETAEDYDKEQGSAKAADIEQEEEALRDLKFSSVIRSMEATPGLVRADMVLDGAVLEVATGTPAAPDPIYRYPEWHYRRGVYRTDWTTIIERKPKPPPADSSDIVADILRRHRASVADIRRQLLKLLATREVKNRQQDGPEFDLEALVERHADVRAGHTPHSRLYLSERKVLQDTAFMLLFDTSLSTDSWVEGRRVLDVEIESMAILSEAFEGYLDDEVSIAHFNSRTRNECNFTLLKKFGDSWKDLRRHLPTIEPHGYTRIGPAIRHANFLLKQTTARRKILLLVSDGKPTDYDQYEGRYGIEDVAQAVREGHQHRIITFALPIDHEAKHYIAHMMGAGHFRILPRASLLPQAMAEFFLRAVA